MEAWGAREGSGAPPFPRLSGGVQSGPRQAQLRLSAPPAGKHGRYSRMLSSRRPFSGGGERAGSGGPPLILLPRSQSGDLGVGTGKGCLCAPGWLRYFAEGPQGPQPASGGIRRIGARTPSFPLPSCIWRALWLLLTEGDPNPTRGWRMDLAGHRGAVGRRTDPPRD